MDPVTAVGAVSAVVSIVSDLQHLCSKLRRFAKSLKHAPAELEMVINETEIFWQLLDRFHDLVEEDDDFPNDGFQANIQSINISKRIAHASRYSYEKLRDMLAKFEPIRPRSDTSIRAKLQKWLALWQFYGWKDEWAQIQLSMSSTKQNAQLLLELVSFETLLHKMKTMQLGNNAVPGKVEKLMMRLDRQKEHIKSLRSSVKRLQRQCERQELGNEERHAFEINVVLAQETGKTIRAYIEQHQDIKIIFNSDAPVSTLFVGTGTSSQSSSASAGAGSQPSSRASNVPTPDTSLAAESSRSPGGSEVSHGHEDVLAKADDQSNEDFWVPRRHLDAIEPWPRSSRPRFPTPRPHDGNDNVVERDDRPVIRGRHYPHQRFPPIRPLRLEQRLRFPEDRPAAPLPQTPDGPAQDVVVDRDDGLGPRNEYRPPRKPRRPPNPKT